MAYLRGDVQVMFGTKGLDGLYQISEQQVEEICHSF